MSEADELYARAGGLDRAGRRALAVEAEFVRGLEEAYRGMMAARSAR